MIQTHGEGNGKKCNYVLLRFGSVPHFESIIFMSSQAKWNSVGACNKTLTNKTRVAVFNMFTKFASCSNLSQSLIFLSLRITLRCGGMLSLSLVSAGSSSTNNSSMSKVYGQNDKFWTRWWSHQSTAYQSFLVNTYQQVNKSVRHLIIQSISQIVNESVSQSVR